MTKIGSEVSMARILVLAEKPAMGRDIANLCSCAVERRYIIHGKD